MNKMKQKVFMEEVLFDLLLLNLTQIFRRLKNVAK